MNRLSKWARNRYNGVYNEDEDIPLLDAIVDRTMIPCLVIVILTIPMWAIPYAIYRAYFAERLEDHRCNKKGGKHYLVYKTGYGWICPECGYMKEVKEWKGTAI